VLTDAEAVALAALLTGAAVSSMSTSPKSRSVDPVA
jgi:hypothetical protein